ncbi:E3 ubiquitin protein ligase DRIP2-like [Camellia sinensis]|uniref:E3 ubiquitin protein ligase DRIP2-like n=1 Tax=Camellia sinensis TaxID=4442 RepID=UPI0010365F79|nr:E3 ubiquitin protein ligase DRIP2-like [Camellia sinensis]
MAARLNLRRHGATQSMFALAFSSINQQLACWQEPTLLSEVFVVLRFGDEGLVAAILMVSCNLDGQLAGGSQSVLLLVLFIQLSEVFVVLRFGDEGLVAAILMISCNLDGQLASLVWADHSVQHIKAAIFDSLKRREPNPLLTTIESMEPEVMPTIPLLSRSKERPLSSLVSQPKASNRAAMSRRKKSLPRKFVASRGSTLSVEELMKNREAIPENSSPLVTLTKIAENKKPNFFAGESSKQNVPCECAKAPVEPLEGTTALWKPLNCLVETAGITKPGKSIVQESVANSALPVVHEDEENANKITKLKERANKSKVNNDEGRSMLVPSGSEKPKRKRRGRPKRAMATEGTNIAPQAVVNAASTMEGDEPLPQLLSCYLMIKDANVPVSSIQKFVVDRLDLNCHQAEVEISLKGQPLHPSLRLHNLIDLWLQTIAKSEEIKATVGSSAKDCVMVLCYGWKPQPC